MIIQKTTIPENQRIRTWLTSWRASTDAGLELYYLVLTADSLGWWGPHPESLFIPPSADEPFTSIPFRDILRLEYQCGLLSPQTLRIYWKGDDDDVASFELQVRNLYRFLRAIRGRGIPIIHAEHLGPIFSLQGFVNDWGIGVLFMLLFAIASVEWFVTRSSNWFLLLLLTPVPWMIAQGWLMFRKRTPDSSPNK